MSQTLRMVALKVRLDLLMTEHPVAHGVFRSENELISVFPLGYPFAEPLLAVLRLVEIGCIDKVATIVIEGVEYFEGSFFATFAHHT
jgi:hypothetical protein